MFGLLVLILKQDFRDGLIDDKHTKQVLQSGSWTSHCMCSLHDWNPLQVGTVGKLQLFLVGRLKLKRNQESWYYNIAYNFTWRNKIMLWLFADDYYVDFVIIFHNILIFDRNVCFRKIILAVLLALIITKCGQF